ncbi:hypothetical protein [Sulfuritalea hydrogenivorans]|uniref:Uncharacterized protein n=1 Tax=Sulfuritalea hydrogenivorans sk43H TaxID=1223802 RepID=W0SEW3_9PROT|nr:hypothetical protein [Sulfuritalea hydrogenivorans]BAO29487.1 hypothetical protein SUTH_01694 [Sulfuritalea hydrogenivorans sk43H]
METLVRKGRTAQEKTVTLARAKCVSSKRVDHSAVVESLRADYPWVRAVMDDPSLMEGKHEPVDLGPLDELQEFIFGSK